jgi:hypothetical protein
MRLALVLAAVAFGSAAPAQAVRISTESNRADLVSGGDVLVRITGTGGRVPRVNAGQRDVTTSFARRPNGRIEGLVTGLKNGRTPLTARLPGGRGARLTVTNHPASGPVIAGPQTQPWVCRTDANELGAPLDPGTCAVPARVTYVYRSSDPTKHGFDPYDPAHPPTDVATTTTDQGKSVPFVVRVESGVMDRGIYSIALLADPKRPWEPWAPQPGWNGKVLWPFGGDCKPYHAQDPPVDPLGGMRLDQPGTDTFDAGVDEVGGSIYGNGNVVDALSRGFAVADSANNKYGSQCNSVVSAEAILMLKEHIEETYGPIRYTIGAGSSGGSMQQHQIASAYPGLLDGIQPMASFPDIWETVQEAEDCHLLDHYFASLSGVQVTQAQQDAVTGALVGGGCRTQWDGPHGLGTPDVGNYAGMWLDPANAPGCGLDKPLVYDRASNGAGVRCTLPDYMVSIFGRRASDGFANRPYDNVGVQYGLHALQSGRITPEQFVDMNEHVGGLSIDWTFQPERSQADPAALTAAYRGGLISNGRNLARVPIVDIRGQDNVEIHADFHSHAMRARLDQANGTHDNQVIWEGARPLVGDPAAFTGAFDLIDRWLGRIEADKSRRSRAAKVRADRPRDAVDTCWVEGQRITDQSTCRAAFPYYGDPRIAAGGRLADDVVKCHLRPLAREEYPAALTDAQFARLGKAFPGGVCDHDRPGVGQRAPVNWPMFASGPGGRALGPAPRSKPLGGRR